jgi:uracil-DNA glycosylase
MTEIDWDALDQITRDQLNDSAFRELSPTLVPGEGDNPIALIIGEAPGAEEDIRQRTFVGASGHVQRQLMSFAGLWADKPPGDDEPNCWLTNAVKFRPPRNRKPYWIEILAARPYLRREWIAIGKPRLIITIGGTALSAVLGRQCSILRVAGEPQMHTGRDGQEMILWPMLHPAFGLRVPDVRTLIEQDWERLGGWIKACGYARNA